MEALVTMSGWVGGDIEYRNSKTATASFRLACTPRVWRPGGWTDGETTWFTVTCFRTLAENAAASIAKGDAVVVSGKLRTQVWERDGVPYERTVLEAQVIGHDLTRGTSAFRKLERQQPVEDTTELHELIDAVERQPADEDRADSTSPASGPSVSPGPTDSDRSGPADAQSERSAAPPRARKAA